MKYCKILCLMLVSFAFSLPSNAQNTNSIFIGQSADSVQYIVAKEVQMHYDNRGWLMKLSAQTIDYKGEIKEVVLCKENVLINNFDKGVNLCIHHMISKGVLTAIVIQYYNLNIDEIKSIFVRDRRNVGGYFFDRNYKHYSRLFIANNGLPTDEYRETIIAELPLQVRQQLEIVTAVLN